MWNCVSLEKSEREKKAEASAISGGKKESFLQGLLKMVNTMKVFSVKRGCIP